MQELTPAPSLFLTLFPTGSVGQLSQPQMLEVLRELRAEVKQQKAREKAQAALALAGGLTLPARRADLPDAELPADWPSASPQKSPQKSLQKAVSEARAPPALSFGAHLTLEDHRHKARVGALLAQPPRQGERMLNKYPEEKMAQGVREGAA